MLSATWIEFSEYLYTIRKQDRSNERVTRGRFSILTDYFSEREYTEENVYAFFKYLEFEQHYKHSSMNNYIKFMRHLNRYLAKKGLLNQDFMNDFAYYHEEETFVEPLSEDEITRLVAAGFQISPMVGVMIEIFRITGMRNSEMYKLKWEDVKNDRLIIRDPKSGSQQYAWLSSKHYDLLMSLPRFNHGCVFGTMERPMYQQMTNILISRAAKLAGINRHVHAHLLRHTTTTIAARRVKNSHELKNFLRHKSIATSEHYVHLNLGDQANVAQAIDPEISTPSTVRDSIIELSDFINKTKYKQYLESELNALLLKVNSLIAIEQIPVDPIDLEN